MTIKDITLSEKKQFNTVVQHPLQSYDWGEFREKTHTKVIRKAFFENEKIKHAFQLTIHPIPHTKFTIGYLPKGDLPTPLLLDALKKIGREENCIFIQLEPNTEHTEKDLQYLKTLGLKTAAHPLFTKFTFILDLTPSEDDLLKHMHSKTRYNIRVAQKHSVEIIEDNSEQAFEEYWRLTEETTSRQNFYAHTKKYHKLQWETFNILKNKQSDLKSHMFFAKYKEKTLAAWVLFTFQDTLYYPYGSSTSEHREVMASNLIMWEAIKFGKAKGLKKFDMWGAMNDTPDTSDPWYGFHRFKQGYGGKHTEFIGSFDLVINPLLYPLYVIADKVRWTLLKFKK